jgi:anti-sigma factor RsiW
MICDDAEILLHLLLDGEIDAAHARDVKSHAAACPRCGAELRQYRALRAAMSNADLRLTAPRSLRSRIEAGLPRAPARRSDWRSPFRGFALGAALSAAAAATLLVGVIGSDQDQVIVSDVVSAHLRSLNSDHLTDLQSGDRQRIKPWLTSRLAAPPPVPDMGPQGITLLGARIDYVQGQRAAALVYERDHHVINVFIAPGGNAERSPKLATLQGVNVELWSEQGLKFCVVADIDPDALQDFREKFEAAAWASHT